MNLKAEREMEKVGRNDSCPCGSGKKYKSCCLEKKQSASLPGARKFTAKLLSNKMTVEKESESKEQNHSKELSSYHSLMERSFGQALKGEENFPSIK